VHSLRQSALSSLSLFLPLVLPSLGVFSLAGSFRCLFLFLFLGALYVAWVLFYVGLFSVRTFFFSKCIARRSLQAKALNSGMAAPRPLSLKRTTHLARMVLEILQLLVESRAHIRDRSSSRTALLDKVGTLQCPVSHLPCCVHLIEIQPLRRCCEEVGDNFWYLAEF
jgi:hypothetical protein